MGCTELLQNQAVRKLAPGLSERAFIEIEEFKEES